MPWAREKHDGNGILALEMLPQFQNLNIIESYAREHLLKKCKFLLVAQSK